METRLDEVSDIQSAVVVRLAQRTIAGIDMIERIVAMTGLNVNELISSMDIEGLGLAQGGPYFDIAGDYLISDDPDLEFQSSVVVLNQQMDRWEALQEVIRTIPLASPLDHYRVSSGYGERADPVNGRKAMHYGVDLKAPLQTPIMATAPGTVVFAGWRGEYGRVVEIDHGNGIRTRYAHLRKFLVKKGQEVAHREEHWGSCPLRDPGRWQAQRSGALRDGGTQCVQGLRNPSPIRIGLNTRPWLTNRGPKDANRSSAPACSSPARSKAPVASELRARWRAG
jgi:hypothetical protein